MQRRASLLSALLVALALLSLASVAWGAPPQESSPNEVLTCRVRITGFTTDDTSAVWQLENQGMSEATISRVVLRYPTDNGEVNEASLNGPIWQGSTTNNPAILTPTAGSRDDRTIAAGEQASLTIQFANAAANAPYQVTITFTQGCMATDVVEPPPPTETPPAVVNIHGVILTVNATSETEGTLTVETMRGTETVNVSSETTIVGDRGLALTLNDLQPSMVAGVQGTRAEDGSVDAVRIEARLAVVEFPGVVLSMPDGGGAGSWRIGAATVTVDENTQIAGEPTVGSLVRVTGIRQNDGIVRALRIWVVRDPRENQPVRFRGPIQTVGESQWVVAGVTVAVDANTEIVGTPEEGRIAEVLARVQADGSLLAVHITVLNRRVGEVVFRGPINAIGDDYWMVGTIKVNITSETVISGTPAVGLKALVRGQVQPDRSVTATSIKVMEEAAAGPLVEFEGTVVSMPVEGTSGDWGFSDVHVRRGGPLDSSVTVMVDARTTLDESRAVLQMDAHVWVTAMREGETLRALRIRAISN
ncbi:MAG: DUF5666 domain-containing protein [Ardenticatenaceae bacterium]|nr:DUF5666 domain-containing protein [Ardenticatenaceae bacterium]HBY97844.1 hypothetical protein [Chloroflexota bacterium]